MFERFTEEARQTVVFAQEEARALRHNYVGTEHLLLGLLREEEETDRDERPLHSLGLSLEEARAQVGRIVRPGEEESGAQIPFTPRAKKVLELALREALNLAHSWIAPEHILLGISCENEGVASRILLDFDADSLKIRNEVIRMLGSGRPRHPVPSVGHLARRLPLDPQWLDGLPDVLDRVGREIRAELGRDPDVGDLLLAIACARDTVGGQALHEMALDLDTLWGALERIRQQRAEEDEASKRRLHELRAEKTAALDAREFTAAADLRDEERKLSERAQARRALGPEVLQEMRRRLGLPSGGETGERAPS